MCGGFVGQLVSNPLEAVGNVISNPIEAVSDGIQGVGSIITDPFDRGDITAGDAAKAAAAIAAIYYGGPMALEALGATEGAAAASEAAGLLELGSGGVPMSVAANTGLTVPASSSGLFSSLGNFATSAGGQQLIGAGLKGLAGSQAINQAQVAANDQANATIRAAQIAADAAKFRPVGVTTRFGSSNFGYDNQGNLVNAGYQVAPALAQLQDQLLGQATSGGAQASQQAQQAQQSLFNLGQQYLAQSPEQAAQQYIAAQQRLLQPSRDVGLAQLRQGMFNSGRQGLSIAQGGNLGMANPEAQAYYNALAQQDAQLAADALTKGQQQVQFGAGLFGTGADVFNAGLKPIQSTIGTAGTIESLGQNALDIGSALGGRTTQANQFGAQGLLNAGTQAANIRGAANQYSPNAALLQGLANNPAVIQAGSDAIGGLFKAGQGFYNDIFA